jgi:hypothetical protein
MANRLVESNRLFPDHGQPAPYLSLAVRARNGRVADYTSRTLIEVKRHQCNQPERETRLLIYCSRWEGVFTWTPNGVVRRIMRNAIRSLLVLPAPALIWDRFNLLPTTRFEGPFSEAEDRHDTAPGSNTAHISA